MTGPDGVTVLTATALEAHAPTVAADASRSASDLAYILYTSGSTGVPKGVMLSHANAIAFVDWAAAEFEVGEDDRLSSHAPLHFDLSVLDLYVAAKAGAALVLVPGQLALFPSELGRWIRDAGITVWYSVPSILTLLVLRGKLAETTLPNLRTILFAGEVFPTKYLHQLMQLLPHVRFANLFGPTETNVCTWYEVPRWEGEPPLSIPIGKPACGDEIFAVADDGSLAPPGEVGELYVRGPSVMQGYWADDERTAATLLPNWGELARPAIRRTAPAISRASTRTGTGSSSAAATRRSRAAATGSSSATSRQRSAGTRRSSSAPSSRSRTRSSRTESRRTSSSATRSARTTS